MKELVLEIIEEAKNGQVIIDNEIWPICFNTLLKQNNQYQSFVTNDWYPVLLLENFEQFLSLLEQYLELELSINRRHPVIVSNKERNLKKLLISYLFVNAKTEDFLNPNMMLKQRISFLQHHPLNNLDKTISFDYLPNTKIHITSKLDSVLMETPNRFETTIINDIDTYALPSISYAIAKDTCYIYSILNPKQPTTNAYHKKIKRMLYKINDSVPEDDLNVSPSAVLSLSIFLKVLRLYNIKKVEVVPYLPLRYLSRDLLARDNLQLTERNDFIQTNATNKFIDTFNRLQYHQMIDIQSYPYELDDCLSVFITETDPTNNLFLNSISKKITK